MDTKSGLISWFARNSVAANLLMAIILVTGVFSIFSLKKQIFPEVYLEQVNIRIPYLGAAPQEVETGIIDKVEESLRSINGIKRVRSSAAEGMATIRAEINSGYDIQNVMDEIKTQVSAISSLPEQAEKPVVYRVHFESDVMWLSLYGDANERTLKETAKDIRDEIRKLPTVSKVEVVTARGYEVSIELPEHKLKEYGLTFDAVVAAIRASSVDLPGGSIKSESGSILLRTKGQAYVEQDFENIVLLRFSDGSRLTLNDIATVNDGFIEREALSSFNGKDAVLLRIKAVGNDDTIKIAEQVRQYVAKKQEQLPSSIRIDAWGDSSIYLQDMLDLMTGNLLTGALLVLIVLTLFLEFRVAFWVMVGIPICCLGTLALMPSVGVSINILSLFGFILVLGIVVDDAIIIGESVYTEIEEKGQSVESVIAGAEKVALPATFGVLTTIAAFVPMLVVGGPQAAIWGSIAWVVVLALVFSLIESKWILPAHLVHMNRKPWDPTRSGLFYSSGRLGSNVLKRTRLYVMSKLDVFIDKYYQPFIDRCIEKRYVTMSVFFALFISMIGVINGGLVRWVAVPNIANDFISASLTMQEGTSSEATVLALKEAEQALLRAEHKLKQDFGNEVITHRLVFLNTDSSGELSVQLTKNETRTMDSFVIANYWREEMPEIPGLKSFKVQASSMGGGGGGADIALQLRGTNLDNLKLATIDLKAHLASFAGVYDIEDNLLGGNDEIVLRLKPEADLLGLSLSDVARQVRYGFYGAEAQRLQRDGEEIRVMVRYPREERNSIGNLDNMRIRLSDGTEVPFAQVATYSMQPSFNTINRVNGERAVTVYAAADKETVEPSKLINDIMRDFIPELTLKYEGVTAELDGATQDELDSQAALMKAAILAMFGIYALMAIPLKSYSQPLIIMSVIPFGLIGAVLGHMVLGLTMSMLSIFGLVALAGVVVNDSLIMVDFVNRAKEQGVSLKDAVSQAGAKRFRAIILTSLTTFVGLSPIVFETSIQAQMVIPMAVSLAFGIMFATVITLVLIPALYMILDDMHNLFKSKDKVAVSSEPLEDNRL